MPIGRIKNKTTISTARKVWSWFRFIDNHPFLASTQSASGEWFWIFSKQFLKLLFRPSLSPICVSRMMLVPIAKSP